MAPGTPGAGCQARGETASNATAKRTAPPRANTKGKHRATRPHIEKGVQMFCTNCGSKVPETTKFCPKCGYKFDSAAATSAPAVVIPRPVSVTKAVGNAVGGVADRLNEMAGGTGHVKLKFGDFFTEAFKKHSSEEADELFACGSKSTTPKISEVSAEWPKPWMWSRVLMIMALAFIGLVLIWNSWHNSNVIPGVILMGSFMVPVATMFFFFETNAPRNISAMRMLEMFLIGGVLSLFVALILFDVIPGADAGEFFSALLVGFIEEAAKIAAIVFFMTRLRGKNYILTGLLIGAAVGAGFAAFESAGYAFRNMVMPIMQAVAQTTAEGTLEQFSATAFLDFGYNKAMAVIAVRGMLAIGGHVAWAAIEGAALAACQEGEKFELSQLTNSTFLIFTAICIVLHGVWDTSNVPLLDSATLIMGITPKHLVLIVAIWIVVAVMLNRGLQQVNQLAAETDATHEETPGTATETLAATTAATAATATTAEPTIPRDAKAAAPLTA